MTTTPKRRALGRGLSALLPAEPVDNPEPDDEDWKNKVTHIPAARREFFHAQIEEVFPSPGQPRKRFDEAALEELAESIRAHGIIQPLVVRARAERDGGGFHLIAGERRWRAAQRAGLHEVPVVVQDVDSGEAFERALVENLQRADLNPIEEAEAYSRLVDELGYTQEQVATRVGKERSTVANSLRLLKLPVGVRHLVEEGRLAMGHARTLLSLRSTSDIETIARKIVSKGLSVRATESLIRKQLRGPANDPPPAPNAEKSAAVRDLENRLTKSLGAAVTLTEDKQGSKDKKAGVIEIRYLDLDDLDRLLERLLGAR